MWLKSGNYKPQFKRNVKCRYYCIIILIYPKHGSLNIFIKSNIFTDVKTSPIEQ